MLSTQITVYDISTPMDDIPGGIVLLFNFKVDGTFESRGRLIPVVNSGDN